MSIKVDFVSEIGFDVLYDKFAKHAAANNWFSLRREANSLLIEDGKNMSYIVIVILFFLGLITLWVFLFGILLWILAVVYAIKSDPHRIFIVAEDGKYAVYANSDKGLNMAASFFTSLGARRVTPVGKEPDVEKLYDELVGRYVSVWGSKWKLEKEIKNLMDKGISREEAIRKIYREGKGEVAIA